MTRRVAARGSRHAQANAQARAQAPLLIVSASGRALAASARRACLPVVVLDLYDDTDTRALALRTARCAAARGGFSGPLLLRQARLLAPEPGYAALVMGSGLESRPRLREALARLAPPAGNDSEVIALAKDPARFFRLLDRLGIAHPRTTSRPPARQQGWLSKRAGAAGGAHVRPARADEAGAPDRYFQRFVAGAACSVLFLADGARARRVGVQRLRVERLSPRQPFAFGGAVTLPRAPAALLRVVDGWIAQLTAALGLRGLNGLDFIDHARGPQLLELNPRPTALVCLNDERVRGGLLRAHLAACDGRLPASVARPRDARAQVILWAPRALRVPALDWPGWVTDRPAPGEHIPARRPVCSVNATGATPAQAEQRALTRRDALWRLLAACGP